MGTVFQRGRSDVFIGAFRAWDAKAGKWKWLQKSTGVKDRNQASAIVAQWERAAGMANNRTLTRARAMEVINDILRMAGMETIAAAPSLKQHIADFHAGKKVSSGTVKKLTGFYNALTAWAGDKLTMPVDTWSVDDVTRYYAHLRSQLSDTTANDHIQWLTGVFANAVALAHRTDNPCEAIQLVSNDSVDKAIITRQETAKLLRAMRKAKRRDWVALTALGWHTGHRLQDMLDVTRDTVAQDPKLGWLVRIEPRKKQGEGRDTKGRTVILPLPTWLALLMRKVGDFQTINHANNNNGRVSEWFVGWLTDCGIDPLPVQRKQRVVHLKTYHSFRHAMSSRLAAAGVSGELARLVTDHDSPAVQRAYVHTEVAAIAGALKAARQAR